MPSLRFDIAILLTVAAFGYVAPATTVSAATIGVVAPKTGPYALLGMQVFEGARAAAQVTGDRLVEIDETCNETGGVEAAKTLADAKASIAIGFLCVETLASALPALADSKIAAITISVRSRILMEDALRNGWPLFRMAPSETAEADQIAAVIVDRWKAEPIALVDDGTIYGRELVSAVRQKLEPIGIAPVFTDTLRPGQEQQIALIRRLQKAGATHILVGADRNDVAVIARDAERENIPLTILGGDVMKAANRPVALRDGTLAVTLPPYRTLQTAANAATSLESRQIEPEGNTLPAYAATQLASQTAASAGNDWEKLLSSLKTGTFQTTIGQIRFDATHELADNPYRLLEWRGREFFTPASATE
ncbi:branched-chain amino acid ABC transporter substrate-binding protein [Rhizobium sp.]|uniref:branched-chain amino acid ABC transporter substrate-binding protein n=1 Tax=Rhizobium sp. TaxID=391 RepID=UPI00289E2890